MNKLTTTVELDKKITQISSKFKQLKQIQSSFLRQKTIQNLRSLSEEANILLQKQLPSANNLRKKKQIQEILKKCVEIQEKDNVNKKINGNIGQSKMKGNFFNGNSDSIIMGRSFQMGNNIQKKNNIMNMNKRNYNPTNYNNDNQSQISHPSRPLSSIIARSIICHQMQSQNLKISPSQLDQIAFRMQRNHQVMKQIQLMIKQQGQNLQQIQLNLQQCYGKVTQANKQLNEAAKIQNRTRLMKIKLGITGIFATIGLTVLGMPGVIMGFIAGLVTFSK